jgi:hypothetical protein
MRKKKRRPAPFEMTGFVIVLPAGLSTSDLVRNLRSSVR